MEDNYFYTLRRRQVKLIKQDSARLIVPTKSERIATVGSRLSRSSRLGIDAGTPNDVLVMRGDSEKLADIDDYRDISCTRASFLDEDGYELFLTCEVLLRFRAGMVEKTIKKLMKNYPCSIIEELDGIWRVKVQDPGDVLPLDIANALFEEEDIRFAEPNALQSARFFGARPKDTFYSRQWHLENTGQFGGRKKADIEVVKAWAMSRGDPRIRIVIHDTGVDEQHPDLKSKLIKGRDFDNADNDTTNKRSSHGTACAGLAASPANSKGVVGVAPLCKIVPIKAANKLTWDTWRKTFRYAASKGHIISCSWGISENETLHAEIKNVSTRGRGGLGVPIFCAVGNAGINRVAFPARSRYTVAVGASTDIDTRAEYSNYGRGLDLLAPSSGGMARLETTDVRKPYGQNSKGNYCKADDSSGFGGTSGATPIVAGVAGLMMSENPRITTRQIVETMRRSCRKIDGGKARYHKSTKYSRTHGYGRLSAFRAVQLARKLKIQMIKNGK